VFQIVLNGTNTFTLTGGNGPFNTVNHNLGYVPLVVASVAAAPASSASNVVGSLLPAIVLDEFVGIAVGNPVTGTVNINGVGFLIQINNVTTKIFNISMQTDTAIGSGYDGNYTFNWYILQQTASG
jgi:hypothetical protein